MKKCINCGTEINEGRWCTMKCKEAFLLCNFSYNQCIRVFEDANKEWQKGNKIALQEFKDSKLNFTDFLLTKGNFKKTKDYPFDN